MHAPNTYALKLVNDDSCVFRYLLSRRSTRLARSLAGFAFLGAFLLLHALPLSEWSRHSSAPCVPELAVQSDSLSASKWDQAHICRLYTVIYHGWASIEAEQWRKSWTESSSSQRDSLSEPGSAAGVESAAASTDRHAVTATAAATSQYNRDAGPSDRHQVRRCCCRLLCFAHSELMFAYTTYGSPKVAIATARGWKPRVTSSI